VADYDDSPYIRIARNGSVTEVVRTAAPHAVRNNSARPSFVDDESIAVDRPIRGARPMPKRLSEEAREAAEYARRASLEVDEIPEIKEAPPKKRVSRKAKAALQEEPEQIALPLKQPKERPDSMVKQRHVLGFCCIVAAICFASRLSQYSINFRRDHNTKALHHPRKRMKVFSMSRSIEKISMMMNADA